MKTPVERMQKAKEILQNPMYMEAMQTIKANLFDEWSSNTIWNGKRKREKVWDMMQAVIEFEKILGREIQTGKQSMERQRRAEKLKGLR